MKKLFGVLAAVAVLAAAGRLLAHEGHAHKLMGTVAVIDDTHIEIETEDAKKESGLLTKDTKFRRGKAVAAAADVKVGSRVVLSVVEKDGKKNVTEVQLGDGAATERKHP